jgi:hypothetical protein
MSRRRIKVVIAEPVREIARFADDPRQLAQLRACGNHLCSCSTSIDDETLTFGSGELDEYGFWEHPCLLCGNDYRTRHPDAVVWPCIPDPWEPDKNDELTWNTFKYVAERLGHDKFTTITTADSFTVHLDDGRSASGIDLDALIAQLKG